jgi:hypothetical protein
MIQGKRFVKHVEKTDIERIHRNIQEGKLKDNASEKRRSTDKGNARKRRQAGARGRERERDLQREKTITSDCVRAPSLHFSRPSAAVQCRPERAPPARALAVFCAVLWAGGWS